jgi:hypothetical protein
MSDVDMERVESELMCEMARIASRLQQQLHELTSAAAAASPSAAAVVAEATLSEADAGADAGADAAAAAATAATAGTPAPTAAAPTAVHGPACTWADAPTSSLPVAPGHASHGQAGWMAHDTSTLAQRAAAAGANGIYRYGLAHHGRRVPSVVPGTKPPSLRRPVRPVSTGSWARGGVGGHGASSARPASASLPHRAACDARGSGVSGGGSASARCMRMPTSGEPPLTISAAAVERALAASPAAVLEAMNRAFSRLGTPPPHLVGAATDQGASATAEAPEAGTGAWSAQDGADAWLHQLVQMHAAAGAALVSDAPAPPPLQPSGASKRAVAGAPPSCRAAIGAPSSARGVTALSGRALSAVSGAHRATVPTAACHGRGGLGAAAAAGTAAKRAVAECQADLKLTRASSPRTTSAAQAPALPTKEAHASARDSAKEAHASARDSAKANGSVSPRATHAAQAPAAAAKEASASAHAKAAVVKTTAARAGAGPKGARDGAKGGTGATAGKVGSVAAMGMTSRKGKGKGVPAAAAAAVDGGGKDGGLAAGAMGSETTPSAEELTSMRPVDSSAAVLDTLSATVAAPLHTAPDPSSAMLFAMPSLPDVTNVGGSAPDTSTMPPWMPSLPNVTNGSAPDTSAMPPWMPPVMAAEVKAAAEVQAAAEAKAAEAALEDELRQLEEPSALLATPASLFGSPAGDAFGTPGSWLDAAPALDASLNVPYATSPLDDVFGTPASGLESPAVNSSKATGASLLEGFGTSFDSPSASSLDGLGTLLDVTAASPLGSPGASADASAAPSMFDAPSAPSMFGMFDAPSAPPSAPSSAPSMSPDMFDFPNPPSPSSLGSPGALFDLLDAPSSLGASGVSELAELERTRRDCGGGGGDDDGGGGNGGNGGNGLEGVFF